MAEIADIPWLTIPDAAARLGIPALAFAALVSAGRVTASSSGRVSSHVVEVIFKSRAAGELTWADLG